MDMEMELESLNAGEEVGSIEEMFSYAGECKRFQWIVAGICFMLMLPPSYQVLIMYFASLNPPWTRVCADESVYCHSNVTFEATNSTRCSLRRSEWQFTEATQYSIVTYFDIYCKNSWLIDLSLSISYVGRAIGSLILGLAADIYGRKKIVLLSVTAIVVLGFATSFITNLYLLLCFRFLCGFFVSGVLLLSVLLSELVGSKYRAIAGTLIWLYFTIDICILGLIAYFIRNWKLLFIVCTAPYIFLVLFYRFLPESPRWLRVHGKMDDLSVLFKRIARINNMVIPPHVKVLPLPTPVDKRQGYSPLVLFSKPKTAMISFITGYAMLANGIIHLGLSIIGGDLGGSLYLNYFLLSFAEVPAICFGTVLSDGFNRKYPTLINLLLTSISCLLLSLLPVKHVLARVIIAVIGKFCVTASFGALMLWCLDLYPTSIRANAIGFVNFAHALGLAIAPWVIFRLRVFSAEYIFMAVNALISFVPLLFLWDTKALPTMDTEEDMYANGETRPLIEKK